MFNKLNNVGLVFFPGYEGCFFGKTINADFMKPVFLDQSTKEANH